MNNVLIDFQILPLLKPDEMKRLAWDFEANSGGNGGIDVLEDIRKNLAEQSFQAGGHCSTDGRSSL
jgi:hypothetical protein